MSREWDGVQDCHFADVCGTPGVNVQGVLYWAPQTGNPKNIEGI